MNRRSLFALFGGGAAAAAGVLALKPPTPKTDLVKWTRGRDVTVIKGFKIENISTLNIKTGSITAGQLCVNDIRPRII